MHGVILDYMSLAPHELQMEGLFALGSHWDLFDSTEPSLTAERINNADWVLTNKVVLGEAEFAANPNTQLVVIMATGTNNVDLDAARKHGVTVCNVVGYSTSSVVQYTIGSLLMMRNRLLEYHQAVVTGQWEKSPFFSLLDYTIDEVAGQIMGIVGYGTIGQAVEKAATALGMQVIIAESLSGKKNTMEANRVPLNDLLVQSDVVSIHCPLTPESHNMIDAAALKQMKSSAILINAGRGGIVNEADLAWALTHDRIFGAVIDVLASEPPEQNNPLRALSTPRLLITPHVAWASRQARQRLVQQMTSIITGFCEGMPVNQVN